MRRIGIIAAMAPEMDLLREALEDAVEVSLLGINFYCGTINNNEVVLSLCGVGKVNAAMAATLLVSHFECDFLINTGIAGGVSPLETKDVIIATSLMYHDFDTTIFGYDYGQVPQMPKIFCPSIDAVVMVKNSLKKLAIEYKEACVFTGDQFVSSMDALRNMKDTQGACCEMEGAGVAHVAVKAGVDFIVLRYISDVIGKENQINDYLKFESEMANRSAKITLQILNNF